MFLILIFILPILVYLYFELKNLKLKRALDKLPGAPTLPVVGNAHQMGKNPTEILNKLFEWWNEFGRTNYRIWIGYYPNISIVNPKDMEFILSSNTLIEKSDVYEMLYPWLGQGLLTSSGSKWHKHRKMITPSFHFKILQDFHEVMNLNSTKFIDKLKPIAAGDNIFDIQDRVHYLTLDVICDTAMGVSINAMDNNDSLVVQAFKDMCYNVNMRAFHPWKRSNTFYRFASEYPQYQRTLKILQDFTNEVIEARIAVRENGNTEADPKSDEFSRRKQAFLDTLLTSTIDGRPLNQQEIYEEVSTFMFEGHDTTTSGISFAIYLLSRHQDIQRKLYEEQRAVMDDSGVRDATFQEIAEMKYLDLFIKEAQRVYPSVPIIGRYAEKDYDMNGTFIPKGTTLNLMLIALGYDDRIFKDPCRFNPERFETDKPGPFEYLPFSAGPRNCIGQKFALLEIKTVVSKIVRKFQVLPALDELSSQDGYINTYLSLPKSEQEKQNLRRHKYEPILTAVLTLKSENGLFIRLRER